MLDPCAADLVDAIARLCVLRTEDYTLVNTVFKRERTALAQQRQQPAQCSATDAMPAAYMHYLTEEARRREEERRAAERRWCESVRSWAHTFLSPILSSTRGAIADASSSTAPSEEKPSAFSPVYAFWSTTAEEEGRDKDSSFQEVYAAVIRHAYELAREDLINTPFAQLRGTTCLYAGAVSPSDRAHGFIAHADTDDAGNAHVWVLSALPRVYSLFFSASRSDAPALAPLSPAALLQSMRPLSDDAALTEASRSRLASSRHVWLVLFFLWCHAVCARCSLSPAPLGESCRETLERWFVEGVLLDPASAFLRSQSQQLEALLTKVQNACGG